MNSELVYKPSKRHRRIDRLLLMGFALLLILMMVFWVSGDDPETVHWWIFALILVALGAAEALVPKTIVVSQGQTEYRHFFRKTIPHEDLRRIVFLQGQIALLSGGRVFKRTTVNLMREFVNRDEIVAEILKRVPDRSKVTVRGRKEAILEFAEKYPEAFSGMFVDTGK